MRGQVAEVPGRRAARHRGGRGSMPGWQGVLIVITAALAGAVIIMATRASPDVVLGIFLVAGTLIGGTLVQARRAYLIIPVPAPAYAVAVIIAGLVRDQSADTSRTVVALNAATWLAGGFVAMSAATLLAIVIVLIRWTLRRSGGARDRRELSAPGQQ